MTDSNNESSAIDPTKVAEVRKWTMGRSVLTCRFDPSGRYIVAGEMDTPITQFDLTVEATLGNGEQDSDKSQPVQLSSGTRVQAGKSWIASLAFSNDGKRLFASDHTGLLMAFEFPLQNDKQTPVWRHQAHQGCLRAISVSPDGDLLATCGNDDCVRLWSTTSGERIANMSGHEGDVYNVAFHPSGKHLVSSDVTGVIKHWDIARRAVIRELDMKLMFKEEGPIRVGGARSMMFDPDGRVLACGGLSQIKRVNSPQGIATAVMFDWESGKQQTTLLPKGNTDGYVNGLAFHRHGYVIGMTGGASSRAGILMFWKPSMEQSSESAKGGQKRTTAPDELKTFFEFKTATSGWAIDLHSNQRQIAVAHHDRQLRLYDLSPISDPATERQ